MRKKDPFLEIRPYTTEEIPYAINRLLMSPRFVLSLANFIEDVPVSITVRKIRKLKTIAGLQKEIFVPIIQTFQRRSIEDLTFGVLETIDLNKPHLFIANHRDIVMDSAMLQVFMITHDYLLTRSGIGDNLLTSPLMTDLAKVNNMFTVFRTHNSRTMLANSRLLSDYIRKSLVNDKVSVWLSQRSGRTKDGLDKTQQGVLKMLYSSKRGNVLESFKELDIVPLTVSYEYEPCDQMKARELLITKAVKSYIKNPQEDMDSIIGGVFSHKGRVHIQFGKPINELIDSEKTFASDNDAINYVEKIIDNEIYKDFRLWENNYLAYDILHGGNRFADVYNDTDKHNFVKYIRKQANISDVSYTKMKQMLLTIYANPVESYLKVTEGEE